MISILRNSRGLLPRTPGRYRLGIRSFGNIDPPFKDDLTPMDDDLFNLQDFQQYKESPDVLKRMERLLTPVDTANVIPEEQHTSTAETLESSATLKQPVVFVSKLSNPYTNLALEDYIYNKIPKPDDQNNPYTRLMFYINSPCVVIGKNQNPWKEVNLPLLNSLHIPLVRRRSGGGTVVHDAGNVNFSFMTSKQKFDRFTFAELVVNAVNSAENNSPVLKVNERGDIVTEEDSFKVSGSAYKISRGKSYHHGTMLLNSRLDILGKLLHRDVSKLGSVDAMASISSVRSPVTNIEISSEEFIDSVSQAFGKKYAESVQLTEMETKEENDHNEMFNLSDFVLAGTDETVETTIHTKTVIIDDTTEIPQEVVEEAQKLKEWSWCFGSTPKFSHELSHESLNFKIKFYIDKHAVLDDFELSFLGESPLSEEVITESFAFLKQVIEEGRNKPVEERLKYTGSSVAGFVTNDMISDWIGECIDGTI
ncbi:putative lipoate-protein ligase A [[Candida] anglica]|uniref:Putative lipoate-protein ligase A n=1 Tax=[Candida] anglica TaxID=148631 RepID=A0ABP0EDR3_9ASCO